MSSQSFLWCSRDISISHKSISSSRLSIHSKFTFKPVTLYFSEQRIGEFTCIQKVFAHCSKASHGLHQSLYRLCHEWDTWCVRLHDQIWLLRTDQQIFLSLWIWGFGLICRVNLKHVSKCMNKRIILINKVYWIQSYLNRLVSEKRITPPAGSL